MKSRVLITGGAGFIGTNLTEHLVENDYEVIVVDDLSAGNRSRLPTSVQFQQLDVRDTQALSKVAKNCHTIVHLAALPRVQFSIEQPVTAHDVNVNGTLSVLVAAQKAGVKRVVFASSSAVYGDQETLPLSTQLPTEPKSPYALHKLQGEEMLKLWSELYGIQTVSLRFFNVYGPHLDPDGAYALVIGLFLRKLAAGEALTITGDGKQTRDFIHVKDLALAIEKSILSDALGKGEVLNLGSGTQTSINEIADLIGGEREYIAPRIEPRHSVADITETKKILDWQPSIELSQGIAELKKLFLK